MNAADEGMDEEMYKKLLAQGGGDDDDDDDEDGKMLYLAINCTINCTQQIEDCWESTVNWPVV